MLKTFIITTSLSTLAISQTILQFGSGELPSCAENCPNLTNAQYLCVPPVAPTSDQTTYDTCFCNSNYFQTNLATGSSSAPGNACNDVCTNASDQLAIQNWYDGFCKDGTPGGTSTATGTAATPTATGTSATPTSTTQTSGSDGGAAQPLTSGQTWWDQHARWIAMAIVLICAFFIILVLGIWLKRRSNRKHQRAAALAPPVVWGPHQNQHYTGGIAYRSPSAATRTKGKGREMTGPSGPSARGGMSPPVNYADPEGQQASRGGKLKKLFGRS